MLVNAFVGGMVGLERAVVPLLAEREFQVAARAAILAFIVSFGAVKALSNLAAGAASDRFGRKRVLVTGWLLGLPVPFLLMWAPTWGWVVFANALLGLNQGLCWSTTVVMKVDLVGPQRRGLAMGLNEASGYLAVSLAALASGYVAAAYGLRPQPFYLGVALALAGLLCSVLLVRETRGHARYEAALAASCAPAAPVGAAVGPPAAPIGAAGSVQAAPAVAARPSFARVLLLGSWRHPTLFSASQVGMVNNLNDGVVWGLFPLLAAASGLGLDRVGFLAALYPAVWGLSQLGTGPLSDRVGRRGPIVLGMWMQAAALIVLATGGGQATWAGAMVALGVGTALVYPTLLGVVSDVAHPDWRASALGVYRLWRDAGYAVGALGGGLLADVAGLPAAIAAVGGLTFVSGAAAALMMGETLPARRAAQPGSP